MSSGPSTIELTWTVLAVILLTLSVWQWRVSVGDYKVKREQAKYRNGTTHAGMRLARLLSFTILFDCLILFAWAVAGSLSIFRHYIEVLEKAPGGIIIFLLFFALLSFGARVVLRAFSRTYVNRL